MRRCSRGDYSKQAADASFLDYERSTAQVKIALPNGNVIHEVEEGNGPVAALDAGLRKGLLPVYCRQAPFNMLNYMLMETLLSTFAGRTI